MLNIRFYEFGGKKVLI